MAVGRQRRVSEAPATEAYATRDHLVAQRRALILRLGNRAFMEATLKRLVLLQQAIDAVDKAIDDETEE